MVRHRSQPSALHRQTSILTVHRQTSVLMHTSTDVCIQWQLYACTHTYSWILRRPTTTHGRTLKREIADPSWSGKSCSHRYINVNRLCLPIPATKSIFPSKPTPGPPNIRGVGAEFSAEEEIPSAKLNISLPTLILASMNKRRHLNDKNLGSPNGDKRENRLVVKWRS